MPDLNQIRDTIASINVAGDIDQDVLDKMGHDIYSWYEEDENSRSEWTEKYEEYMKLATQVKANKSFPWPDAANVKYPLLSIASLQFASRAYQSLVPNNKVVKARVIGEDPDGQKAKRASRISNYMSYQLLEEMDTWEDQMDRTCLILPIIGNVFKKTYWDGHRMMSDLVLPKDLCVDYYATSLEDADRKTHKIYYYPNEITSYVRSEHFLDVVDTSASSNTIEANHSNAYDELQGITPPANNSKSPHCFLECHCWWDLDDDGYQEPYVITIHKDTKQVVRIAARYDEDGVKFNDAGDIVRIIPVEYFTNYIFINDPNSGVYGMGFGSLLGPLNEATNTIINQLLDSGTINNLQAGFLSKGIKMTNGNIPLKPGEWRYVNTIGDDLRKGIVPIPSKEPSNVLFSLLSMMIQSGQQLSSVTDIMTGSSPGQNQPWSTTSEVLRQGLQVFSSIYKRIHRSMKREFKKIARLNSLYMEEKKYFAVLDPTDASEVGMIGKSDFEDGDMDVVPNSDPTNISNAEKLAKAESLMQLLQLGAINPQVATKRILEASDQEGIDELMQLPEKQPSFEEQIKLQELQLTASSQEITKSKTQYQAMRDQAAAELTMTKAKSEEQRIGIEKMRLQYAIESKQTELAIAQQNETMQQQMAELERMQKQIDMVAKASGYELDYEERVSKLNDESIARQRQLEEDEKARTSSIVDPNQSVESEQTE